MARAMRTHTLTFDGIVPASNRKTIILEVRISSSRSRQRPGRRHRPVTYRFTFVQWLGRYPSGPLSRRRGLLIALLFP